MTAKHNLSRAGQLYYGNGDNAVNHASNDRPGVPIHPLTKVSLGSPIALALNGLIKAATLTALPNSATTLTYTPLTDNVAPLDGTIAPPSTLFMNGADRLVWVLDVPRNITSGVAHASTTVAMSILISGYDVYKQPMTERLTLTASSSSASPVVFDGKKAFKYVASIAITAGASAAANTLNMGWGDVLGLPYALQAKSDLISGSVYLNDALLAAPTVVKADATTATAATGDVRGTVLPASATDGNALTLFARFDPSTNVTQFGVTQA